VSLFKSLGDSVQEVIETGQSECFSIKEIGQFIREEMTKAGLTRQTISHYFPSELKAKPGGIPDNRSQIRKKSFLNSTKSLEFEATVTINSDKRKIANPAKFKDVVDKSFIGRKINVRIWY